MNWIYQRSRIKYLNITSAMTRANQFSIDLTRAKLIENFLSFTENAAAILEFQQITDNVKRVIAIL